MVAAGRRVDGVVGWWSGTNVVARAVIISTTARQFNLMGGRLSGADRVSPKSCSTSSDARCEAGMHLKGTGHDPEPLATASFRLLGLHPIRATDGHILGHLGRPARDDDFADGTRAARVGC